MKKICCLLYLFFCINSQFLMGMEENISSDDQIELSNTYPLFFDTSEWHTLELYEALLKKIHKAIQSSMVSLEKASNISIIQIKNKVENFNKACEETKAQCINEPYAQTILNGIKLFKEIQNVAYKNKNILLDKNDEALFKDVEENLEFIKGSLSQKQLDNENLVFLDKAIFLIKDDLLANLNTLTNEEFKQINHSYSEYKQRAQNYLKQPPNNAECNALIQKALVLISNYEQLASKKNISIDKNVIKNVYKIRSNFLNEHVIIEDAYDDNDEEIFFDAILKSKNALFKNTFLSKKREFSEKTIPSLEELEFQFMIEDYKNANFNNHQNFLLSSWKDFSTWKKTHESLDQKKLVKNYIDEKVCIINKIKIAQFKKLHKILIAFSVKAPYSLNFINDITNDKDFGIYSQTANLLLQEHEQELCSLEKNEQMSYVDQLLKTAQLVFFKNTEYKEYQDILVKQPLDCLLFLYDFFNNDTYFGHENQWCGYIDEDYLNNTHITIGRHIKKYKELKKKLFVEKQISDAHIITLHALARISFQGLSKDDLHSIKNILFSHSEVNSKKNLTSVYQFTLFFHHQALKKSDIVINASNGTARSCFLDWHKSFNQDSIFGESIDLKVLSAKENILCKNVLVKKIIDKHTQIKSIYPAIPTNNAIVSHTALKEHKTYAFFISFLLYAYEKYQKICKNRFINAKQYWQEAEQLWQINDQNNSAIDFKNLFSTYTHLMINYYHLANSSPFNKNVQLPEFTKRYEETYYTLSKLQGAKDIYHEAHDLIFINWWQTLYKYKPGDTFADYTQIKEDLIEKARYLHYECQIHTLIKNYFSLLYTTFREVIQYKEGFEFFMGKSPFPDQTIDTLYLNHAWQNMRERNWDVANYFKEKIFT